MRAICVRRLWFSLASFSIISALWLGSDSLPTGERTSFSSLADSSGSRSSRRVPVMLLPDDELVGAGDPAELPKWLLNLVLVVANLGRALRDGRSIRPRVFAHIFFPAGW